MVRPSLPPLGAPGRFADFAWLCAGRSFDFFVDLVVDLFFITDVAINCRTSYYDANGFRENRPDRILKNYLKGWFFIDFFSCLPFGYVQYFFPEQGTGGESGGDPYKAVKAARLMKLSKMMRLARLKRILMRHGSDTNFQQWMPIMFTTFLIIFLTHMLACFHFFVGGFGETLNNGQYIPGWVEAQDVWKTPNGTETDPSIALNVRYISSMYYVLNALESGSTTTERAFGVFAELMRDVILGLVAGLITTITMSMSSSDNETNLKLKQLRTWMSDKKMPKGFRMKAMEHFNEVWTNNSSVDVPALLQQCPPAMGSTMSELLYGRFISTVPLFKGLSPEVISAICLRCKNMTVMKNQNVISEGEPGKEMYMLMSGEVEVTERRGQENMRLGFLSEGAFFGEAPVLGSRGEIGLELRTRTVRAVSDVELCYITRDDVHQLSDQYAELKARMSRFSTGGKTLTKKHLRKIDMTKAELKTMADNYKQKVGVTEGVRAEHNLDKVRASSTFHLRVHAAHDC